VLVARPSGTTLFEEGAPVSLMYNDLLHRTYKTGLCLFSSADSHDASVKSSRAYGLLSMRIHMRDTRMHGLQLRLHRLPFRASCVLVVLSSSALVFGNARFLVACRASAKLGLRVARLPAFSTSPNHSRQGRTMLTFVLRRGYTDSVINRQYMPLEVLDVVCAKYSQAGRVESGLTTISLSRWRISNHERPRSYRDYYPTVYF
jgi:hypothetical protein